MMGQSAVVGILEMWATAVRFHSHHEVCSLFVIWDVCLGDRRCVCGVSAQAAKHLILVYG